MFQSMQSSDARFAGLGARLVLIVGAKTQTDAILRANNQVPQYVGGYRVTDEVAMQAATQAAGAARVEIEAQLSRVGVFAVDCGLGSRNECACGCALPEEFEAPAMRVCAPRRSELLPCMPWAWVYALHPGELWADVRLAGACESSLGIILGGAAGAKPGIF